MWYGPGRSGPSGSDAPGIFFKYCTLCSVQCCIYKNMFLFTILYYYVYSLMPRVMIISLQWSYGVTMWEIFSGGKSPYPGTDPLTLMQRLEEGDRMPKPYNAACTEEM